MPDVPPLPPPPRVTVSVARDRTAESRASGGFVNVRRLDVVAKHPDGAASAPFKYDVVDRDAIDAVVIVAYERRGAEREVWLRSCPRVPLLLRPELGTELGNVWELPAGIVDVGEAPRATAARELCEELGYRVAEDAMIEFAPFTYPAPGFVAERHFYFAVDVTGVARGEPSEDGSALERSAALLRLPVSAILAHCRAGAIRDAKTELALRRFAETDHAR